MKWFLIVAGLVLAGLAGSVLTLVVYTKLVARTTTTSRLSPDETIRARLLEGPPHIDRNFSINLEDLARDEVVTIFRSPDEGGPPGTERLIWSKDGTKLLLVGRHFFVKEDLFLDNGDQLYFLHDLPTGKSWCNSAEATPYPPLKADQVQGVEFTEPVDMKAD
ncbi:hypothetical protein P12x_002285 [Tundrisphaera lichenicola]|uniref:hypothetical protein n=1 Tax=Tundrisphaera lichenicola TaxID=2029860 RepID=UPI003EBBE651